MDYDKAFIETRDSIAELLVCMEFDRERLDLQVALMRALKVMNLGSDRVYALNKKITAALVQMESASGSYPENAGSYPVGGSKLWNGRRMFRLPYDKPTKRVVKHGGDTGWPDDKHPWRK